MYSLLSMVVFQPAMLAYQRVMESKAGFLFHVSLQIAATQLGERMVSTNRCFGSKSCSNIKPSIKSIKFVILWSNFNDLIHVQYFGTQNAKNRNDGALWLVWLGTFVLCLKWFCWSSLFHPFLHGHRFWDGRTHTWRIIQDFFEWFLIIPIYKPWMAFGRGTTPVRDLRSPWLLTTY